MGNMDSYENNDIDLGFIFGEIARHKMSLLLSMVAAGGLTWLALSFVDPVYTAQSRILIQNAENSYTKSAFNQNGYSQNSVSSSTVGSQVQVLKSNDLAQKVIDRLGLQEIYQSKSLKSLSKEDVLETFIDNVKVSHITGTNVIGVGASADNPALSAKIANSLSDQFILWQQKSRLEKTTGATSWLKEQIEALRSKVASGESLLEKFRSKHGILTGENNISLDTQQLTAVNRQLLQAKTRQSDASSRVQAMTQIMQRGGDVNGTTSVLRSGLVQRLLELKATKQSRLSELGSSLLPSHPRMKRLRSEITGLSRQITTQMKKVIASLKNEQKIAALRVNSLSGRLNVIKKRTGRNSQIQARFKEMERDLKSNRTTLVGYMNRYQDVSGRKDDRSLPIKATIISKAYMSTVPSFPRSIPAYSLMAAFAAGLLALLFFGTRAIISAPTRRRSPTGNGYRQEQVSPQYMQQEGFGQQASAFMQTSASQETSERAFHEEAPQTPAPQPAPMPKRASFTAPRKGFGQKSVRA